MNRRLQQPSNRLEKKMLVVSFWITTVGDPTKLDTTCLVNQFFWLNQSPLTAALGLLHFTSQCYLKFAMSRCQRSNIICLTLTAFRISPSVVSLKPLMPKFVSSGAIWISLPPALAPSFSLHMDKHRFYFQRVIHQSVILYSKSLTDHPHYL